MHLVALLCDTNRNYELRILFKKIKKIVDFLISYDIFRSRKKIIINNKKGNSMNKKKLAIFSVVLIVLIGIVFGAWEYYNFKAELRCFYVCDYHDKEQRFPKNEKLVFYRGKKKVFTYETDYFLGVMDTVFESEEDNHQRLVCALLHHRGFKSGDEFDYKPFLRDMRGSGKKEFLFLCGWSGGGNSSDSYIGVLLDIKHFKIIDVKGGEILDIPLKPKELTTSKEIYMGYFGALGAAGVSFPFRYTDNGEWEFIGKKVPFKEPVDLSWYKDCKAKSTPEWYPEAAITHLYCMLAENGWLKHGKTLAKELGYTPEEIEKYNKELLDKLRDSEFYPYLVELNGEF